METRNVIHFYLGCNVKILNDKRDGKLIGIFISKTVMWGENGKTITEKHFAVIEHDNQVNNFDVYDVTLLLRPLSSMTEEEKEQLAKVVEPKARKWNVSIHHTGAITIETWANHHSIMDNYSPNTFTHLLSKGFDLFGLIESGDAIDSTKELVAS